MGPKHRLMIELRSRLGTAECRKGQLSAILGPPDRVARPGDAWFARVAALSDYAESTPESTPDSPEFLVYYWRGSHDFLYFVSSGDLIVGAHWWYEGE